MRSVIVSRHPAAIQFIASRIHPDWHPPVITPGAILWYPVGLEPSDDQFDVPYDTVPVIASATADDVRGANVYGNLPMHLAALADTVYAVEFTGPAPRGQEYTMEEMLAAGATLTPYRVTKVG